MHTLTASVRPVPEQLAELRHDYPHSIALSYGDRQLSYDELDRRADRFAGYLAQLGVKSGGAASACDAVAICMERSFDWIVAALGIMRAGAAYVPLDPAWPEARLRFAIKDSGATVLVARSALLDRLQAGVRGVDPCRDSAAIAAAPVLARRPIAPESLAYVIYTSGSTGVPKGVEITHANLAHLIRWHQDAFSVTRRDRTSHLAGLGFDAAVWELWPHLSAGATVCLAPDSVRTSPESIQRWMIAERITIGFVPTVLAEPMMAMEWPESTALRVLLTGGDTLRQAPRTYLPFHVVNNYGPAECTVVATSGVLRPWSRGTPSIGRPIAGACIYLLDERGQPVSDGSVGEICIGGAGVGRGYRNLPELTERSFLPDRFAQEPGARMYRTGDRGARRPDGQIEFRGRLDRQTKIRGQRVELDEIGCVLSTHPRVEFATAIVCGPKGDESRLVAYVLPRENFDVPAARDLQQHLRRSLPDCMIPATFVRMHALPLSPSGKLDLTLLERPSESNLLDARAGRPVVPAGSKTSVEDKLLALIRELLECDAVGAEDNFFLAGGHSLLGMQLVMVVDKAFGVDLTLQQLFEAPTIERLAFLVEAKLHERRVTAIWADLLRIERIGLDDNFFLLGGRPDQLAELRRRIATEFELRISIADLRRCPTIRNHAALTHGPAEGKSVLPPGVLALNPYGTRERIFWLHYVNGSLANALGDDRPFSAVTLTPEDAASLGESPTLEAIAACHTRKILATQPAGPYTIGGQCLGGILAHAVARQLRTQGNEVSLLVLLDPPTPAFLEWHGSLPYYLRHPRYFVHRARRLGVRGTVGRLRELLLKRFPRSAGAIFKPLALNVGQRKIEAAAAAYRPEKYDGRTLLLLASDRPPSVNFLPAWQAAIPHRLHTQYLKAHHRELATEQSSQTIAAAIDSHLASPADEETAPCASCDPALASSRLLVEVRIGVGFEAQPKRPARKPRRAVYPMSCDEASRPFAE